MNSSMFKARPTAVKIRPLADYLSEQEKLLANLKVVLTEERKALRDRDMKTLANASQLKSSLMVNLQSNDQRIKLHPDEKMLKGVFVERVNGIKANLKECQILNEINGKLIRLCMNSCHKVQSLLMGARDNFTKNMTYTEKGNTIAKGLARVNIQA